jgi:parvulin-like peptidyl-prolyl isomerase
MAALVNGQPVYLADYERELARYEASLLSQGIDPSSAEGQEHLAQARAWVLNVMIEQALTEQAAAAVGVVVSDAEVDAYMQEMIDENGGEEAFRAKLAEWGETYEDAWREVRAQLIGMAMTQRIVDSVPTSAEHVHARHILVDTSAEAERILAQLQAGGEFAALAKTYSQDTSTRESGGDLGFFPRGILVAPEVEEAAFALQPGQFSGVVTSALGYHIVQVVERDPARAVSPENLRLLQDRAVQEWIEGLWAQAAVQRFVETTP